MLEQKGELEISKGEEKIIKNSIANLNVASTIKINNIIITDSSIMHLCSTLSMERISTVSPITMYYYSLMIHYYYYHHSLQLLSTTDQLT